VTVGLGTASCPGTSAKNVLKELLDRSAIASDTDVKEIAGQMGLLATPESAQDELRALCQSVIEKLPAEADSVRKGKDKVVMRLVGQVMKDSKGTADAKKARELLLSMLSKSLS
jgi:aspartyl-tRNA(Asn)/glutamyl-tRNA(Gln) amidotransferase subunit B